MATSTFFNNYGNSQEQALFEDLIIEQIKIYGLDMYYVPRKLNNLDKIYLQDDISSFDIAYQIEMHVLNVEGFQGDSNLMSKFGLEIRDQVTFMVARRTFDNEIKKVSGILRPNEGDLIYYPADKKLFEIKYVDSKPFHYPLGALPVYHVHAELYEYSQEKFDTGIEEIDQIETQNSINMLNYAILAEDGRYIAKENGGPIVNQSFDITSVDPIQINTEIATENDDLIDFSEINPFSEEFK